MHAPTPPPPALYLWLLLAAFAVSAAAVLARLAEGATPEAIAFVRVAGSALLLAPWLGRLPRTDAPAALFAGLSLAAHFVIWFAALQRTTVLHSTVLVCLSPIWVALIERWRTGTRQRPRFWLGIALSFTGSLAFAGDQDTGVTWQGDALSVLAGVAGAAYLVATARLREDLGAAALTGWTCLVAAGILLPFSWGSLTPQLWPAQTTAAMLGCVLIPQIAGHGGLAWTMRWIAAPTVAAALLLEPVGAAILAWLVLGEAPSAVAITGGAASMLGLAVILHHAKR